MSRCILITDDGHWCGMDRSGEMVFTNWHGSKAVIFNDPDEAWKATKDIRRENHATAVPLFEPEAVSELTHATP